MEPLDLKREVNINEKTALKLVNEIISSDDNTYLEFNHIQKKIIEKCGLKAGPICKSEEKKPIDKNVNQRLRLYLGESVGYKFKCVTPPRWECTGEDCNVSLEVSEDLMITDQHYTR